MKLHEQIALILRALKVDVVFGLVGDANLYMMNRFQAENGRFVPVANESAALLAAAGGFGRTVWSIAELDAVTFRSGTALINVMTSAQEQSATA